MRVKNIHSGDRPAPSGYLSWLDFWLKKKGKVVRPKCANLSCDRLSEHGGHVKKVNSTDNSWYIVPLCVKCNEKKDLEFEVNANDLVPVNN